MKLFTTKKSRILDFNTISNQNTKKKFLNRKTCYVAWGTKNKRWLLPEFKTLIDIIKHERCIKCKASCKVDLKCLYLDQLIKNSTKLQFLKWDL